MNANDEARPAAAPPALVGPEALSKAAIWVAFFLVLYLARDFFFVAFMTFLFCYVALGAVGWGMSKLASQDDRPRLRRLLTVAMFVLMPTALVLLGRFVAPPLVEQGYRLAGWLDQASAESEVSRILEKLVGPSEFRRTYGGASDPRYQKELEAFRASGVRHVQAYQDFPHLEGWVEGGFSRKFADAEQGRIRQRLTHEGTSSVEFAEWFISAKAPQLKEQARRQLTDAGAGPPAPPLVRAARADSPEQLLELARRDSAALGALRQEWIQETTTHELAAAKKSPAYLEQFRVYYDDQRAKSPATVPYTFAQFVELKKARAEGRLAFGNMLDKLIPTPQEEGAALAADFEAAKQHELFQTWWGANPTAKLIRQQVEMTFAGTDDGGSRIHGILLALLNIPLDLGTALLLAFFICIDYPHLRAGFGGLRQTWLKGVYDEIVPALASLGHLIGCSLRAQGMIALCNASLLFVALGILGVEHAMLLCVAVFVLCLVPTLGVIIAWALIAAFALVQPGGGPGLALQASVAVVLVLLLETFVLSPRILGRLMELHPVLVITILPIAQYFFGIKGLILAVPVTVYVIQVIIMGRGVGGPAPPKEEPSVIVVGPARLQTDTPAANAAAVRAPG